MKTARKILSAPSGWELASQEKTYSCDQVIDAYLNGINSATQSLIDSLSAKLEENVSKTVEQINKLISHLKESGFNPVDAYLRIDDWDSFTIMITVPENEWRDKRFLKVFEFVLEEEEHICNDSYALETLFCGIDKKGNFNELAVYSDGFLKFNAA